VSITTSLRRVVLFIIGVAFGLFLLTGAASAEPQKDNPKNTSPQPASKADYSGNGANKHGDFDSTRDGSPSGNGNGGGEAKGKPCAGCVGKADNKNPKAQKPRDADRNAGYECDRNHGIGRSNPAHTGCKSGSTGSTGGTGGTNGGNTGGTGGTNTGTNNQVGQTTSDKPADSPTLVAGVQHERAATPAVSAGSAVLSSGAARGGAATTLVAGALNGRAMAMGTGVHALPLTGAGAGVMTLALVAIALLGIGFMLVRRSRVAVAG